MNLLARARISARLMFASPSPGKRLRYDQFVTALLQFNFYSTRSTTYSSQRTQQFAKPRAQKSSESSLTFAQRVKRQTEVPATVWPKPTEIPYQAKVANFVNLIGHVKVPVHFETDSDGKHFATTVISVVNGGGTNPFPVSAVFEGNLAHVVACHVKKNDCIFVSGRLSVEPVRTVLSEGLGKFHVVAENLNFVEGFKIITLDKKAGVSFPGVEIDEPGKHGDKKVGKLPEIVDNDERLYHKLRTELEPVAALGTRHGADESKPEKAAEKSGKSAGNSKDGELDLWRDLVKNPLQWWDYRDHKSKGLVKEKFPDFKQKVTNQSLWVNSAPDWVLAGLGKLEFDVKGFKPKESHAVQGPGEKKENGKPIDLWANLVENPDKWYDNRTNKKNPKAPDFKHKETGEVLWLNRIPAWALSKLPPLKENAPTL